MSVEQLEQSLLSLSQEERRHFVDWFYENESRLIDLDHEMHPEARAAILDRRQEALNHPENLEPLESAFPKMKRSFDELRGKNTHPG